MRFNSLARSAVAAVAISMLGGAACAQSAATQTTTSSGKIIQPITLTAGSALAFGTLVRPGTGSGTVTVRAPEV